jgi:hypothetical protein
MAVVVVDATTSSFTIYGDYEIIPLFSLISSRFMCVLYKFVRGVRMRMRMGFYIKNT